MTYGLGMNYNLVRLLLFSMLVSSHLAPGKPVLLPDIY
jgi:hypothetical protein